MHAENAIAAQEEVMDQATLEQFLDECENMKANLIAHGQMVRHWSTNASQHEEKLARLQQHIVRLQKLLPSQEVKAPPVVTKAALWIIDYLLDPDNANKLQEAGIFRGSGEQMLVDQLENEIRSTGQIAQDVDGITLAHVLSRLLRERDTPLMSFVALARTPGKNLFVKPTETDQAKLKQLLADQEAFAVRLFSGPAQ